MLRSVWLVTEANDGRMGGDCVVSRSGYH